MCGAALAQPPRIRCGGARQFELHAGNHPPPAHNQPAVLPTSNPPPWEALQQQLRAAKSGHRGGRRSSVGLRGVH